MVNGSDASFIFGDNFSVFNSTVMLNIKLQRCSRILNYHITREAQAKGVIKFLHMNFNENSDAIVTKIRTSNTWLPLLKPLLFWINMDFLKEQVLDKGS